MSGNRLLALVSILVLLSAVGLAGLLYVRSLPSQTEPLAPAAFAQATRLILVETPDFGSSEASVRTFERSDGQAAWRQVGDASPARVGRAGLGWGHTFQRLARGDEPIKKEGDKRAPAGLFALAAPFGSSPEPLDGYMRLQPGRHLCVDDTGSEQYSRIVPQDSVPEGTSGERMWEIDLYKRGIVVDYPTSREARSGSCIFVHVWKSPDTPTVGCVAMGSEAVARLQEWTSPLTRAQGAWIAIVPRPALERLGLRFAE